MKLKHIFGVIGMLAPMLFNNSFAGEKEFLCSQPGAKLSINSNQLIVRNACSREQLTQGLMHLKDLPPNSGMLFVFQGEHRLSFWSKNTYIPIDIAYINDNLEIVDINTLKPLDTTVIISKLPASYALEVNAGWFAKHNIKVGDKIVIKK